MQYLLEMLSYGFMQRAFLAGLGAALIAPVIGVFVVTRRQSMVADTLSHVALAGVAAAALFGAASLWGAVIATLIGTAVLEALRGNARLSSEATLSVLLTGSLSLAVMIMSTHGGNIALVSALFGSLITVTWAEVAAVWAFVAIAGFAFFFLRRPLFGLLVGDELAAASGLPIKRLRLLVSVAVALFIALSLRVTGALLAGSLIVIPMITAGQLGYGLKGTLVLATLFSTLGTTLGILLSYALGLPMGPMISFSLITLFCLASLAKTRRSP